MRPLFFILILLFLAALVLFLLFGRVGRVVAGRTLDLLALFDEILAALGALFARGQIPTHELAGRVLGTAVKNLTRLALQAPRRRAAHGAGACKLGDRLVGAALGAAQVLAVAPVAVNHIFPALGALFLGNFAVVGQNGVAFGIIRAGEELAVLAALDDHVRAALGALGRRNFHPLALDVRAGGVVGAGEEFAVAAALADHRVPALFAEDIRHLVAVVGGKHQLFRKRRVEIGYDLAPVGAAVLDVVQLVLHLRGEADVHDVGKILHQQIGNLEGDFRRHHVLAVLGDVLALGEHGDDGGVGGRAADALVPW